MKIKRDKAMQLAPSDDGLLNDIIPADQLPNFSLPLPSQRRQPEIHPSVPTSTEPLPETTTSKEVTLQQLMDEIKMLSVQQISFQQYILDEH